MESFLANVVVAVDDLLTLMGGTFPHHNGYTPLLTAVEKVRHHLAAVEASGLDFSYSHQEAFAQIGDFVKFYRRIVEACQGKCFQSLFHAVITSRKMRDKICQLRNKLQENREKNEPAKAVLYDESFPRDDASQIAGNGCRKITKDHSMRKIPSRMESGAKDGRHSWLFQTTETEISSELFVSRPSIVSRNQTIETRLCSVFDRDIYDQILGLIWGSNAQIIDVDTVQIWLEDLLSSTHDDSASDIAVLEAYRAITLDPNVHGIGPVLKDKICSQICWERAMDLGLKELAEIDGKSHAQFLMGWWSYRYGEFECDADRWAESFSYFTRAANDSHPQALQNLGFMYEKGYGTKKDPVKAIDCFDRSAFEGNACGQYSRGCAYFKTGRHSKAFEILKSSADCGLPVAQWFVGNLYLKGIGVVEDQVAGLRYLQISAEQGNQKAHDQLTALSNSYFRDKHLSTFLELKRQAQFYQSYLGGSFCQAIGDVLLDTTEVSNGSEHAIIDSAIKKAMNTQGWLELQVKFEEFMRGLSRLSPSEKERIMSTLLIERTIQQEADSDDSSSSSLQLEDLEDCSLPREIHIRVSKSYDDLME